ncbi:MAG: hypothetical protein AB1700_12365 [Bacillota bacterium]
MPHDSDSFPSTVRDSSRTPCGPPVDLITVAMSDLAIRCQRLPSRDPVTLRPAGEVRYQAEGEILTFMGASS